MSRPGRIRRVLRNLLLGVLALVGLAGAAGLTLYLLARPALGGAMSGARLARAERSPQWLDEQFQNPRPRADGSGERASPPLRTTRSDHQSPAEVVPVARRTGADYHTVPASGLRVTWLGHSTLLIEIDGRRVLIDPMWSERASPLSFAGPKRFFAPPLPLAELPGIDVVVISHDHYDHLDVPTVRALVARGVRWVVPLGVGAHLGAWGAPDSLVTELDWWDAARVADLTLTATPARHYSGRSLGDRNRTLWAGWAITSARHRVFYSGDTSLHDEFVRIGERLGPFDLTIMEVGQYNVRWPDVHLGPEQAVLAHRLVRGGVMLPVHWAGFDLATHGWTEPIERVLVAAEREGVRVVAPRPGDMVEPAATRGVREHWWPALPWESTEEAPIRSSGVDHLLRQAQLGE